MIDRFHQDGERVARAPGFPTKFLEHPSAHRQLQREVLRQV